MKSENSLHHFWWNRNFHFISKEGERNQFGVWMPFVPFDSGTGI